ncbi:MAG TPA: phage tail assembly chaperone [Caulobacterales bacterium]|nr:phage tail assembly chaperone [Caulobacterales bacterium]
MPEHWRPWLQAASRLRIAPAAFWRLSVREWRMLTMAATARLDRAAFEALAAQFPDDSK